METNLRIGDEPSKEIQKKVTKKRKGEVDVYWRNLNALSLSLFLYLGK
jgi:hypothetical protein